MASFTSWCRENVFAVAAVVLPLAIVGLFALATLVPRWSVEDPHYDLIFSVDQTSEIYGIRFQRDGNRLLASISYNQGQRTQQHSRLYRFRAEDMTVVEIPVSIPESVRTALQVEDPARDVNIEEITVALPQPFALDSQQLAPDGYRVRNEYDRGAGLFGELFGTHRRYNVFAIEKSARVIRIEYPDSSGYYYGQVQPLGWVEASATDA